MCRIFGHFAADVTRLEAKTVAALQFHGGPDAQTYVHGIGWGLGSNRLAIMDPWGGEQPYDMDGRVKIVFNGELYNHEQLRKRLAARGYRFEDQCDGSVLPALYAEYGQSFADHLDGMYAIAIFDLRSEPTLILVTDELGMKPLYYCWDDRNRHFYFASEIPALLSFRAVSASPWLSGLDTYLATKTPLGQQTMFEHIRVLPPAAVAVVNRSRGLKITRRDLGVCQGIGDVGMQEAAEEVCGLLRREVHRLTRADVAVSAIVSGGLDSSFVSVLAAEKVRQLHTFNIAYRGKWPADERSFAREVAERCHSIHHQVEIDPAIFPDLLPDVVWHLGQPNADPITLSTYALFQAVRQAGFKVALTGDGADELFGGYDRMHAALQADDDSWIARYVDALAAVPRGYRERLYSTDYRDFLLQHGCAADTITAHLRAAGSSAQRLSVITGVEIGCRLPAYHLRRVDHLSMAHAVEVRLPFCQPAVTRLALSLLDHHKIQGDERKRVLYRAARDHVPRSVLNRPKQPFTLPIKAMLRPGEPLLDFARDVLSADRLRRRGMLDGRQVGAVLDAQADRPDDRHAMTIWALLIHELWVEQFSESIDISRQPLAVAS
jgi:asparagine synthase (glutamine-hydrolysing)